MKNWFFLLFFVLQIKLYAQDELLGLLANELERQEQEFQQLNPSPYYLSFKVDEVQLHEIHADFGGITLSDENFIRLANVDVRVGDYKKDNTSVPNANAFGMRSTPIPIDNDEQGVSYMMWILSDLKYKVAENIYKTISANSDPSGEEIASFSKEEVAVYYEEPLSKEKMAVEVEKWESLLKSLSAFGDQLPNIIQSSVRLSHKVIRKYFLDTEGRSIVQNHQNCLLSINLNLVDDFNNQVPLSKTFSVQTLNQLPGEEELKEEMSQLMELAKSLSSASYVEPYSGPVLFSGPASAVFFHEVLGHRIEAERLSQITDGQTFVNKVETEI
ncbi:MAG: hypothetical protein AAF551_09600, partial [Bacteroidota bacterium]